MKFAVLLGILMGAIRLICGTYCPEAFTGQCYEKQRYTTRCYLVFRCSRYRSVTKACTKYRQACCANWEGSTCSTPVCSGSSSCQNDGTCTAPNTCSCKTGFSPPHCADTNECNSGNGGCEQICTNSQGSFTCSCRSGYILNSDGKTCIDRNECYSSNGGCQQKCRNLQGSFECYCNDGYSINTDGKTCSDTDECYNDRTICQHRCHNTIGSYSCSCDKGYNLALDGKSCTDEDECVRPSPVCDQQCHNTVGSYTCSCDVGYSLQADRSTCTDVNECGINNGNCQHKCSNVPGTYTCSCNPGFLLQDDRHNCKDIDECTEGIAGCSHSCSNTDGSYRCSCPPGYQLDADSETCSDIDDCVGIECQNGGTCVDGHMTYTCLCRSGYKGPLCQSDIDECSLLNGGCQDDCTNYDGSFECSCFDNRTLNSNGVSCKGESKSDTVFRRHNITGKGLPKGCWVIEITQCTGGNDLKVVLSSTSTWLISHENNSIRYTYGIVFAEVNKLSIPISLDGVEVHKSPDSFTVRLGVQEHLPGHGPSVGTQREFNCISSNFSRSDKFEFIEANSFLESVFISVLAVLPNWLQFETTNTSALSVRDLKTDLLYGRELNSVPSCQGATVFPEHLYSVFTFGTDFAFDIYGKHVDLQNILSGENFCLIVDICQTYGATLFLMLPKESRGILSKIDSFKTLFESKGTYMIPRGIGVSFADGINVHVQKTELALWNGDQFFNYPVASRANMWIGGDFVHNKSSSLFGVTGKADMFFTVPSIHRILTAVFFDEWNGLVSARAASATLNIELFGLQFKLPFGDILSTTLEVYMSVGGVHRRNMCGDTANPAGMFFSAMLKINPFPNVPILKDWVFDNTHKAYFFFMSDPRNNLESALAVDIVDDIIDLDGTLNRFLEFVRNIFEDIKDFISSSTKVLLKAIESAALNVIDIIKKYVEEVRNGNFKLSQLADALNEIWKSITSLGGDVKTFIDSAELFVDVVSDNITVFLHSEMETIKGKVNKAVDHLNQQVNSLVRDYDGFGLKYQVTVKLFGLKIGGLDVEFVYSTNRLFSCSRFDKIAELLKGQPAARILGRVSQERRLGYFFKLDRGVGVGMAFGIKSFDVVVQIQVFASLLGTKATADLFITTKNIALYTELNVWNIFLAQVDIVADHGKDWYDLTLYIRGIFVAKARKKRQMQTSSKSFDSSYLDALKKVASTIAKETDKRLSQAQNALSTAQTGFSKAQTWLEEKKHDVRNANAAFDNAVKRLDSVKQKLDEAKEPYYRAIRKLDNAQKDVDKLCKIRTCDKICIPGLKCKICKKKVFGVKIPYPCCRTTSCMISIPNPLCVIANAACAILRGIAYIALEAAKIIVRAVIVVYDAAKLAVSVVQVIVDKSRVVLTLAEGVLTLAQVGLEGAKGVLEVAKVALEVLKVTIGAAVEVLNFVIEYGIKQILDVRNCGFEIELSTTDLPVFDVSCEVNAFKLGWKTFRIRINFRNIVQSIWQAAKATIKAVMNAFAGIFKGRKRRELSFAATSKMHIFFRSVRSTDDDLTNSSQSVANDFIDTLNFTDGFAHDEYTDYDQRVDLFRVKCETITKVLSFLNDTFFILFDIANEVNTGIEDAKLVKSQLQQYNTSSIASNLTVESAGISRQYARDDYNITEAELDEAFEEGKASVMADPLLAEIDSVVLLSSNSIDSEISGAESVQMLNQWILVMENITTSHFNASECVGFRDCAFYAITLLYDLYTEEYLPEIETIQSAISTMEDFILDVLQNTSSSIPETFNASSSIMSSVNLLSDLNLFCSEPPMFVVETTNHTAILGSNASIPCHVSANPEPTFWWYKNGGLVIDQNTEILQIENATYEDEAVYTCVAGNIVANITSQEMHLLVITYTEPTEKVSDFPMLTVILVAPLLGAAVLTVAIVVIILNCKRQRRRVHSRSGRVPERAIENQVYMGENYSDISMEPVEHQYDNIISEVAY